MQNRKNLDSLRKGFCARMTPQWTVDAEGAFLDLKGTQRLHGPGADGALNLCRLARREFPVWSAGMASSVLSARLASWVAGCWGPQRVFTIPENSVPAFLAGFPIGVLGSGHREIPRLSLLGVRTLGDLQGLSADLMKAVFGSSGGQLIREAWGQGAQPLAPVSANPLQIRVTGARFSRPLNSAEAEKALRRSLAIRALAWNSIPRSQDYRWSLQARWSSGSGARVQNKAPLGKTLTAWLNLMENLWKKLPAHRQGLMKVELMVQPMQTMAPDQMDLFCFPGDEQDLARVVANIRRQADPGFSTASEGLLRKWGVAWLPEIPV